jgi:tRNA-binding EMAP/Myf-like protein
VSPRTRAQAFCSYRRLSQAPGLLIAEILSVKPHPKADRLKVVDVDFGDNMAVVVTNAMNVEEGMKVVYAVSRTAAAAEQSRERMRGSVRCAHGLRIMDRVAR